MFVFAHKHVNMVKNILNVKGTYNNKNYQIKDYDLGRRIFVQEIVYNCQKGKKTKQN